MRLGRAKRLDGIEHGNHAAYVRGDVSAVRPPFDVPPETSGELVQKTGALGLRGVRREPRVSGPTADQLGSEQRGDDDEGQHGGQRDTAAQAPLCRGVVRPGWSRHAARSPRVVMARAATKSVAYSVASQTPAP